MGGTCQKVRGHAAGLAADEADEVGLAHDPVGTLARIGADDTHRERMIAGNRVLAVERGRDRDGEALGERHERRARARCANAAAGDEHRPLRGLDRVERRARVLGRRRRPERRHPREQLFRERLHLRFLVVDLPLVAPELQVHRPRTARDGDPEGLAHQVGNARDLVHGRVELGHRLEGRHVVQVLIGLAELGVRVAPAGHGDDRGVGEPGVAQAGGEVERAHHLRHADAGAAEARAYPSAM